MAVNFDLEQSKHPVKGHCLPPWVLQFISEYLSTVKKKALYADVETLFSTSA